MAALVCFSPTQAVAGKGASRAKVDVCATDFKLRISVIPAQGEEKPEEIGFFIDYKGSSKTGSALRMQTDQKVEFSQATCARWARPNFELIQRIFNENRQPARAKVVCHNVGSIEYILGTKTEKALVCLGDTEKDGVAYAFKALYESGDALIKR